MTTTDLMFDISTLKPGFYVLSRDVANPKPDRRVKDVWLDAPVWKEGEKYVVLADQDASGNPSLRIGRESRFFSINTISVYEGGTVGGSRDDRQDDAILELLRALVPSAGGRDKFEFIFRAEHCHASEYADDLLWGLVERGVISLGTVKELFDELREDYVLPAKDFDAKWNR